MEKEVTFLQRIWLFYKCYYKSIILICLPLACLNLIIDNQSSPFKSAYGLTYVMIIISGFYAFEVIPLQITATIPIVLFPILDILGTNDTCLSYFAVGTLITFTNLILGILAEYSHVYRRIALWTIIKVGVDLRIVNLVTMAVAFFFSTFIINWAVAALLMPWASAILLILNTEGISKTFKNQDEENIKDEDLKPTCFTKALYLGISFASALGGASTYVGSLITLTIYRRIGVDLNAENSPPLNFWAFIGFSLPLCLIGFVVTYFWLQFLYTWLFNSNRSTDEISESRKLELIETCKKSLKELGRITLHEGIVIFLFSMLFIIAYTSKPIIFDGWRTKLPDVRVSSFVMLTIALAFLIPEKLEFLNFFKKDSELPTERTTSILIWGYVLHKMPWAVLLMIGAGTAIYKAAMANDFTNFIYDTLNENIKGLSPLMIVFIYCCLTVMVTNFTAPLFPLNIIFNVLFKLSKELEIHPYYFLFPVLPVTLFGFLLPSASPSNAIAMCYGRIKVYDMFISGTLPTIVMVLLYSFGFTSWGSIFYPDSYYYPDWLYNRTPIAEGVRGFLLLNEFIE